MKEFVSRCAWLKPPDSHKQPEWSEVDLERTSKKRCSGFEVGTIAVRYLLSILWCVSLLGLTNSIAIPSYGILKLSLEICFLEKPHFQICLDFWSCEWDHTCLLMFSIASVDLPSWFSSMSIAMNSDVDLVSTSNLIKIVITDYAP